jgi:hypothetical protein
MELVLKHQRWHAPGFQVVAILNNESYTSHSPSLINSHIEIISAIEIECPTSAQNDPGFKEPNLYGDTHQRLDKGAVSRLTIDLDQLPASAKQKPLEMMNSTFLRIEKYPHLE